METQLLQTELAREQTYRPIFVLGDHRSGTTLLYQLLSGTGHFAFVTAYHVICYDQLLTDHEAGQAAASRQTLAQRFGELGIGSRVLDQVQVTPDLAEEYGFIIDGHRFSPKVTTQNAARLTALCAKLARLEPDRPILLKNPWDFGNAAFLYTLFPQARFIFIHRHSVDVASSQIRAARTLYAKKSAYHAMLHPAYRELWSNRMRLRLIRLMFSGRFGVSRRITLRHLARAYDDFLQSVAQIPADIQLQVKYETLCAEPSRTMGRILAFLQLDYDVNGDLGSRINPRNIPLTEELVGHEAAMTARFEGYLTYCGYEPVEGGG